MDLRRFVLVRREDVSGCSGVGIVADGVEFASGRVAMQWRPGRVNVQSITVYDSIADVATLHGHDGRTTVCWIDDVEPWTLAPARTLDVA